VSHLQLRLRPEESLHGEEELAGAGEEGPASLRHRLLVAALQMGQQLRLADEAWAKGRDALGARLHFTR